MMARRRLIGKDQGPATATRKRTPRAQRLEQSPLKMRRIPWRKIKPAPYNPRRALQPGEPEYEKIKRSIESFGLVDPLIWNRRSGHLVGGHQRFAVMRQEWNTQTFECVVVDIPPAKEKALNLALNKIAGEWEGEKLAELLAELQSDPEIDVLLRASMRRRFRRSWIKA